MAGEIRFYRASAATMKEPGKILVVDDDNHIILSIRMLLEQYYNDVRAINNPGQIPSALEENTFDVIILDMNFSAGKTSGSDGLDWLDRIKALAPSTSVIFITAYGGIEIAVEGIKRGAFDFLVKPWENDKLLSCVSAACRLAKSQKKVARLSSQNTILNDTINRHFDEMIGESQSMLEVKEAIQKVGGTEANVLILGENGTGKELVARGVHKASARSSEVFINVDIASLAESLFESELFGHKKGAFTDAHEDRIGKFEAAAGGTIFLDEIGNLSMPLQAKLLKVLQERTMTRVGSNETIPLDFRLICATNMNLNDMVRAGTFRQDLLYRINTVEINLPSLRDRADDISILAMHFLTIFKNKYGKKGLYVPDYVLKKLAKHHWPGNIRELQHSIERAVIMSDGKQLHVKDFSLMPAVEENTSGFDNYNLETIEKWAIQQALIKYAGNISNAAKELGLSRGAMYRRMEKYEL